MKYGNVAQDLGRGVLQSWGFVYSCCRGTHSRSGTSCHWIIFVLSTVLFLLRTSIGHNFSSKRTMISVWQFYDQSATIPDDGEGAVTLHEISGHLYSQQYQLPEHIMCTKCHRFYSYIHTGEPRFTVNKLDWSPGGHSVQWEAKAAGATQFLTVFMLCGLSD